jgi:hypothetical protein
MLQAYRKGMEKEQRKEREETKKRKEGKQEAIVKFPSIP